ncbi:MAG: hypothetical protein KJ060_08505 [Candidatus Hydrogenedentes bacterium]|nr:hypothetical protein [Candidatus Hydrogenedentota bacterium]
MTRPEPKAPIDERTLVDYADQTLSPERQAAVERHFADHPDARALVDRYRSDIALLRKGLGDVPPSTAPSANAVHAREGRRQAQRRTMRAALVTCAAGIAAFLLWPENAVEPVTPQTTQTEARLRELNERIADLERQVAALQTDALQHAAYASSLDFGAIAQEESAAIVYEAGRFYERDNRNTAVALSRYRDVVDRFPNTRSAAFAAERIQALTQAHQDEGLSL